MASPKSGTPKAGHPTEGEEKPVRKVLEGREIAVNFGFIEKTYDDYKDGIITGDWVANTLGKSVLQDAEEKAKEGEVQELQKLNEVNKQRIARTLAVDKMGLDALISICGDLNFSMGEWKQMAMLPGEKEIMALKCIGFKGMPSMEAKDFKFGVGMLLLSEEGQGGNQRLSFVLAESASTFSGAEEWSSSHSIETKGFGGEVLAESSRADGEANYKASHSQVLTVAGLNVPGNLLHAHCYTEDSTKIETMWRGSSAHDYKKPEKPPVDCCKCCEPCCKSCEPCCSCVINCQQGKQCFGPPGPDEEWYFGEKTCCLFVCAVLLTPAFGLGIIFWCLLCSYDFQVDIRKINIQEESANMGSWKHSVTLAEKVQSVTEFITLAGTAKRKYTLPDLPDIEADEEQAILAKQIHVISMVLRNTSTNSIQPCMVLVKPDESVVDVGRMACMLSKLQTSQCHAKIDIGKSWESGTLDLQPKKSVMSVFGGGGGGFMNTGGENTSAESSSLSMEGSEEPKPGDKVFGTMSMITLIMGIILLPAMGFGIILLCVLCFSECKMDTVPE